jgi:hypothetical protein
VGKKLTWIALSFVVVIVLLVLGNIASFRFDLPSVFGWKSEPMKATVISSQTIVNGIQPMGQLVSISAQVAKAGIFVGVKQGALNACGYSVNHVAQGTVEAGIDLSQLTENDVHFDGATTTYNVMLPAAQVTSCRIDYIDQYDYSKTACGADWDAVRQLAQYDATIKFRDDVIKGGILDRAQKQAQLTLGNFIQLLHKQGFGTEANVKISFDTNKSSPIPQSCNPEPPQGWVYDATGGSWTKP